MSQRHNKVIPIALQGAGDSCSGAEPFALMVLGDSMLPEFAEGEIIIVEPEGMARDGAYVLAFHQDEWIFRQLRRVGETWQLGPLNRAYPEIVISDLSAVRGVIIQKTKPGRRRALKHYVE
jgi:SOS-response transcriptional repressor LexA